MLARDGDALLEEALAAPGADGVIHAGGARALLRGLGESPSAQVELLLRVVNLGLLAGMVADLPAPTVDTPAGPAPYALAPADWDSVEQRLGCRPQFSGDEVPSLADGVLLLQSPAEGGTWYVAVDGSIEYILDGDSVAWLRFLREIDGRRSLSAVLADLGYDLADIHASLAEAVDEGLVQFVAPFLGTAREPALASADATA